MTGFDRMMASLACLFFSTTLWAIEGLVYQISALIWAIYAVRFASWPWWRNT